MMEVGLRQRWGWILGIVLLWGASGAFAQPTPVSVDLQELPLDRALERVAAEAGISLVYDADLVRGFHTTCTVQDASPEALLRCVLDDQPIDYVQASSGTYVLREAVRRPPRRGSLKGVVRDAEEGTPLPHAHVRLPEASTGTVTDTTGRFRLPGLVAGDHPIVVSHLGYEQYKAMLTVEPDTRASHAVALTPAPLVTDSIVIDGSRHTQSLARRSPGTLSATQLLEAEERGTPGALGAARTLVGVTTSTPHTDLHIQGGDTGAHTLHLDGVPVRNPSSAGRLLGAFSPLALDGLTTRKAGFGALHGSALSGTIHLEHDLSDRGARYGTARIDPLSLNARLRERTEVGETAVTALAAGRVGLWNLYQDASLHELIDRWSTLDPVLAAAQIPTDTSLAGASLGSRAQPRVAFHDLHGAARIEWGPVQRLDVSAYHGSSTLGADLALGPSVNRSSLSGADGSPDSASDGDAPSAEMPVYDRSTWSNTVAQVRYKTPIASHAVGAVQGFLSRYRATSRSELGQLEEGRSEEQTFLEALAQQDRSGREGSTGVMEMGLEGRVDVDLPGQNTVSLMAGMTTLSTRFRGSNAFVPRLRHRSHTPRVTTAGEATIGLGAYTSIESGLRLTALPGSFDVYAEPRAALRYNRSLEGLGTVALRLGGGLYRQFTTQVGLSRGEATAVVPTSHVWLPVSDDRSPPRTYHLSVDVTWQPAPAWQVDLEGYRKWQPHLLELHYPALRTDASGTGASAPLSDYLAPSHGRAYGGGLQIEYDGASVQSSLRYAYTQSERTFPGRFGGRRTPVSWTEPHRLSLDAEVPLGSGLGFDLQGEGVWGRSWGYRRDYYAYLKPSEFEEELRLGRPAEHILPPLYRLNTGLRMTHSWGDVEVEGRMGIVNVLDRANVADWVLQPREDGSIDRWTRTLPGRRTVLSVQVQF